jgi:uncharacterized Ntn-hydrolase superfamily protein
MPFMTWSILARDADGRFGAAIATRFFAVGALCLHTSSDGALSTQALVNPLYGPRGLALLRDGNSAADAVAKLIDADDGREHRQLHVIGTSGAPAAYTGGSCIGWCGHEVHEHLSVAGNMLAGPEVLQATAQTFLATAGRPLAERLIAAMAAGEAAGGDKRGKQSAALRLQGDEGYASLDLRVDDHAEPLAELRRLYEVSLERFQPFLACLPTRDDPVGITDRAEIEARVERLQAQRGARSG